MKEYIFRKLALGVVLILVVTILVFLILHLMPGNPVDLVTDEKASEELKNEMYIKWNLDKPLRVQYYLWLKNVLHGDFGQSIRTKQSVTGMIAQRIPYTLKLVGAAVIIKFLIAIPLGLLAAFKKDTIIDRSLIVISSILNAIPQFWAAILLILFCSVNNKWFPASGYDGPRSLVLPVLAIVLHGISGILRLTKSEVLEVFREKYISTAYAKGLRNKVVLIKHVLRNALIPVCVMFFLSVPWMIGGEVIIENIFSIPGMGSLLWRAISTQDFRIVQACVLIIAILTVVCNTVGDILTAFLDPRIRNAFNGRG